MSAHDDYLDRLAAMNLGMSYEDYTGRGHPAEPDPDDQREMRLERDPFDWLDDEYGRNRD